MIKKLSLFLFCTLFGGMLWAQDPIANRPQRTPEEEALSQTRRLVRELDIKDSVRIDTIYKMHLRYARYLQKGLSRAENMERMQAIYNELRVLLTPEEFERFMNHPAELPRRPRGTNALMPAKSEQTIETQSEGRP